MLLAEYQRPNQPQAVKDTLGAELACREALLANQDAQARSWLSYNLSKATAASLLRANHALWQNYPVHSIDGGLSVTLPGYDHPCRLSLGLD